MKTRKERHELLWQACCSRVGESVTPLENKLAHDYPVPENARWDWHHMIQLGLCRLVVLGQCEAETSHIPWRTRAWEFLQTVFWVCVRSENNTSISPRATTRASLVPIRVEKDNAVWRGLAWLGEPWR